MAWGEVMSREAMGKLIDQWMNEPAFRTEVRSNPEAAIQRYGIELDADEMSAVRSIDWSLPDEELQARISKC